MIGARRPSHRSMRPARLSEPQIIRHLRHRTSRASSSAHLLSRKVGMKVGAGCSVPPATDTCVLCDRHEIVARSAARRFGKCDTGRDRHRSSQGQDRQDLPHGRFLLFRWITVSIRGRAGSGDDPVHTRAVTLLTKRGAPAGRSVRGEAAGSGGRGVDPVKRAVDPRARLSRRRSV